MRYLDTQMSSLPANPLSIGSLDVADLQSRSATDSLCSAKKESEDVGERVKPLGRKQSPDFWQLPRRAGLQLRGPVSSVWGLLPAKHASQSQNGKEQIPSQKQLRSLNSYCWVGIWWCGHSVVCSLNSALPSQMKLHERTYASFCRHIRVHWLS